MTNLLGTLSAIQRISFNQNYINYVITLLQRPFWSGIGPLFAAKVDVLNLRITHNLPKTDCVQGDLVYALRLGWVKV